MYLLFHLRLSKHCEADVQILTRLVDALYDAGYLLTLIRDETLIRGERPLLTHFSGDACCEADVR